MSDWGGDGAAPDAPVSVAPAYRDSAESRNGPINLSVRNIGVCDGGACDRGRP